MGTAGEELVGLEGAGVVSEAGGWGSVVTAPLPPSTGHAGTAADHSESADAAAPTAPVQRLCH